jgi:hypothetical protein
MNKFIGRSIIAGLAMIFFRLQGVAPMMKICREKSPL